MGTYLGPYGGPRGGAVSYERGTPVQRRAQIPGRNVTHSNANSGLGFRGRGCTARSACLKFGGYLLALPT